MNIQKRGLWVGALLFVFALASGASGAYGQMALSLVDGKQKMVDGTNTVTGSSEQDGVTVFDFGVFPPRQLATLAMPTSLVGPPMSAAISPDETLAVVTAAKKLDPEDSRRIVADNRITVIELKPGQPRIVQTVEAGKGVSGISFSPDGRMVVAANRDEGSLSVFAVEGGRLRKSDTIRLGAAGSGPSHAAFTPDGKTLLVTRDGDMVVSLLDVSQGKLTLSAREITAGIRPYGLAVAPNGTYAVVANIGRGAGDADAISVIDLTMKSPRTVAFHTVPSQPEALAISPDGRWVAVASNNGSSRSEKSPFFNRNGVLTLFAVKGNTLVRQADYPIGRWVQGMAFSGDSSFIAVQNTMDRELQFYKVSPSGLSILDYRVAIGESAAALRTRDFVGAH